VVHDHCKQAGALGRRVLLLGQREGLRLPSPRRQITGTSAAASASDQSASAREKPTTPVL